MRSLETIGFCTVAYICGWLAWKYFQADYERLKKVGGPEYVRIEKLMTWSIIGAALIGGAAVATALIWLDGR